MQHHHASAPESTRTARLAARFAATVCAGLLVLLFAPACTTDFGVENRETPTHVWITAPALAERGGSVQALVYVGSKKVVEGPVQFSKGVPTINLPIAYVRTGDTLVSVVIDRGRMSVREEIEIEGEGWVQILLGPSSLQVVYDERQPSPWGR